MERRAESRQRHVVGPVPVGEVEQHRVPGIPARLLERAACERFLAQLCKHGMRNDHVGDQPCPLGRSGVPSKLIQVVDGTIQGGEVERLQLLARPIEERTEPKVRGASADGSD